MGLTSQTSPKIVKLSIPTDFAAAVIECLEDEQLTTRLSNNAQQLIKEEFDNVAICKKIELFLKEL